MKTNTIATTLWAVAVLCSLAIATGCQAPGNVVSARRSEVCPTCGNQTVTSPIKGLNYTRHVCPSCKNTTPIDTTQSYDEIGGNLETVHVCTTCQAIVSICPQCRNQ